MPGCLPMGVGDGTTIRRAIVDKNARIGERCQIVNKDNVKEANRLVGLLVLCCLRNRWALQERVPGNDARKFTVQAAMRLHC